MSQYILINETTGGIIAPGAGPLSAERAITILTERERSRKARVSHGHRSTSEIVRVLEVVDIPGVLDGNITNETAIAALKAQDDKA